MIQPGKYTGPKAKRNLEHYSFIVKESLKEMLWVLIFTCVQLVYHSVTQRVGIFMTHT